MPSSKMSMFSNPPEGKPQHQALFPAMVAPVLYAAPPPLVRQLVLAALCVLLGAALTLALVAYDFIDVIPLLQPSAAARHAATAVSANTTAGPSAGPDMSRLLEIASRAEHMKYFPREKLLVGITAKAGSTSMWKWLYVGMSGLPEFNCRTYVQDTRSDCWNRTVLSVRDLKGDDLRVALTDPSVLRVAVWRDPFYRLVSCWKSKFACNTRAYHTDWDDRQRMVPQLRKNAALPDIECLNITEYATTLEVVRKRIVAGQVVFNDLNPHLRPQEFFFSDLSYQLVLDVTQLSDPTAIRPIADRLPYGRLVKDDMQRLHQSTGGEVDIPAPAAALIARFARLSEERP